MTRGWTSICRRFQEPRERMVKSFKKSRNGLHFLFILFTFPDSFVISHSELPLFSPMPNTLHRFLPKFFCSFQFQILIILLCANLSIPNSHHSFVCQSSFVNRIHKVQGEVDIVRHRALINFESFYDSGRSSHWASPNLTSNVLGMNQGIFLIVYSPSELPFSSTHFNSHFLHMILILQNLKFKLENDINHTYVWSEPSEKPTAKFELISNKTQKTELKPEIIFLFYARLP